MKSNSNAQHWNLEIIWMFRLLLIKKDKHTPLLEETPGCSGFFTQIGKEICSLTTDLWSTDMTIVRSCACLRGRRGADDGFSITNCVSRKAVGDACFN